MDRLPNHSQQPSILLLPLLLLSASITLLSHGYVDAHGMLCEPRQRGAYHEKYRCGYEVHFPLFRREPQVRDYCGHCLNGGTAGVVKANLPAGGWGSYDPVHYPLTSRRAGLCGDAVSRVDHMLGGAFMPYSQVPITAVWKAGSAVDFTVEIDTNHNGYFEFHVCDLDKCGTYDIAESCFRNGACYRLERVKHADCEDTGVNTHYECGPVHNKFPYRWYVPCRNTGHVGVHMVGGSSGTMRFQLPKEIKECKHCVLQWYWATANSCNPPGVKHYFTTYTHPFGSSCESDGGGRGAYSAGLSKCGGQTVPEEFWSCADVQITRDGKPLDGGVKLKARPVPMPPKTGDEEAAKKNTSHTIKQGQKEIEKDVEREATQTQQEEKKEERMARKGNCLLENQVCDATVPCCDTAQVCVYTIRSGMFTCRFWWGLWQEAEDQEKKRKNGGMM